MSIVPSHAPVKHSNNDYPVFKENIPTRVIRTSCYELCFAHDVQELHELQKLRHHIFHPGESGIDEDQFDAGCHHLIVKHIQTNEIVGTYRMQTNDMANAHHGFYSDQEYVLSDFPEEVLSNAVEVGRACVREDHRNGRVLHLLWRGIAMYMTWNQKRYVFGCSSLFSQDPKDGYAALELFRKSHAVHENIWVRVRDAYACTYTGSLEGVRSPTSKLLNTYITIGSRVCSAPALDRDFKSIDFLTLFDLKNLRERAHSFFFGE